MTQVNMAAVSPSVRLCRECASANGQKKAGQVKVSSIYGWRLRNEEAIYYGSPLAMYAYLYVCVRKSRERKEGGGTEHHH